MSEGGQPRIIRAHNPTEYYETPTTFTRWLFEVVPIGGRCIEPCAGRGAIVEVARAHGVTAWRTNDRDPYWPDLDSYDDAADPAFWRGLEADWVVTNPPYSTALAILDGALSVARQGVALHLRASFLEPLRTGARADLLRRRPPDGMLWLPRFAYQRSPTTGAWTTDAVTSCWVIWGPRVGIVYPPADLLDALARETPTYRAPIDAVNAQRRAAA